jgi:hypothetical protein
MRASGMRAFRVRNFAAATPDIAFRVSGWLVPRREPETFNLNPETSASRAYGASHVCTGPAGLEPRLFFATSQS